MSHNECKTQSSSYLTEFPVQGGSVLWSNVVSVCQGGGDVREAVSTGNVHSGSLQSELTLLSYEPPNTSRVFAACLVDGFRREMMQIVCQR